MVGSAEEGWFAFKPSNDTGPSVIGMEAWLDAPAGLEPGQYDVLGHQVVLDKTGRLNDLTTGYLAGSSATMLKCMNHLASLELVSFDELFVMGFDNPLTLIGLGPEDVATGRNIIFDKERKIFQLNA